MKRIIIDACADWGFAGTVREEELEIFVEDNATDEEIEGDVQEAVTEWMWNYMDLGYEWRREEGKKYDQSTD
jgi:hypothetical protein